MNVRMILQLSSPGMEHAQATDFCAEIFGAAGDVLQGTGAFAQQQSVTELLVRTQPGAQPFGHREGDEVIGNGQELELLLLDPFGGVRVAALGTGPVITGVIDKMIPPAVLAAIDFPAQGAGAAFQNALHGAPVRRQNLLREGPLILRPMPAQNFRQRDHTRGLAFERLIEGLERDLGARFADGRQMRVDDGSVE